MVLLAAVALSTFALSDYTSSDTASNTLAYAQMSERCGIDIPADTISYGNLVHGAASNGALLQIDNPASAVSHVSVSGTGWASVENTSEIAMPPSATHFSSSTDVTIPYSDMTPLSSEFAPLVSVQPSSSQQTLWKVMALPTNSSFGGTVSQEMTFRVMCEETGEDDLIVMPITDYIVESGDMLSFTVATSDAYTLTFSLSGEPAGASIDADTGLFMWTPDDSQIGTYTFDVVVTNHGTPPSDSIVSVTVRVSDTVSPVITLNSPEQNPQVITIGNSYQELGATAADNADGDITGSIIIDSSSVNANAVGEYAVTYDVADSAGNEAIQAVRTVTVHKELSFPENELQKIIASDGSTADYFGVSVAISGDTAIVGAYQDDDDNGYRSGSAYIFTRDDTTGTWTESQKITASDSPMGGDFGYSVAISDDVLIVGASGDEGDYGGDDCNDYDDYYDDDYYDDDYYDEYDDCSQYGDHYGNFGEYFGSAYIFTRDTTTGKWTESKKIIASDGSADDMFGYSVAISGDTAIVGAYADDDNGRNSGSAYIFTRDTTGKWTESQKITASDSPMTGDFGSSVAISGDVLIVGANSDDDNGYNSGSVYIFTIDDTTGKWTESQKITASDGSAYDYFGVSVAISGDVLIVGAHGGGDNGRNSGSAYIFTRDTTGKWTESQKITASDGSEYDDFGYSVAISSDTAIVGANTYLNDYSTGLTYIFTKDNTTGKWTESQKIIISDGSADDYFGYSVAISGDTAIVGASGDVFYGYSDSAYVFTRE